MTLYEIDEAIRNWEPEIDEETGELLNGDMLDELHMGHEKKIEGAILAVKNLRASSEAHRKEASKQYEIAKSEERKAEGYRQWLNYILDGQPFETGKCKARFTNHTSLDVEDERQLIDWCEKHNHDDYVRYEEPTIRKKPVTDAIKAGEEIPFCHLETKKTIAIS